MKIFIGCSSRKDIPKMYLDDCKLFLDELFSLNYDLVYGACNDGIMGYSYDSAIEHGRDVIGIYPLVYKEYIDGIKCSLIETATINKRTEKVIEESDVLVFLPGGIGTIYELFTAIENKRSGGFNKPIIIYNSCGYFDKLLEFLGVMYDSEFASASDSDCYYICKNAKDALNYINNYYNI